MERSAARSGGHVRANSGVDNQRACEEACALSAAGSTVPGANESASTASPQERGHEILMRLLQQITEFLARKEMMSTRVEASKEWRKSRSRRRQAGAGSSSNYLFDVVIQVCEQRMRRLQRATLGGYGGREHEEWGKQSPRVLVAEAIVQELLVSLMELRIKEKEALVLDEVENVEVMRQLQVHLQRDEEMVRNRVCVAAGDEQQLEELQQMLRTDFLNEVAGVAGRPQDQQEQQSESETNNDASLQFAWETINDQKKEIVRLRAENEELKRVDGPPVTMASSTLGSTLFSDEPARAINVLRAQLSSHHDKNLDVLHDHIQRLEKALRKSTAKVQSGSNRDAFASMVDPSRVDGKGSNRSSALSRSTVGTDFSRTQVSRRKCDECRKQAASLMALQSELKQLRAQATADEDSFVQTEKERAKLQRENSALSSTLLSARQKQEELRQMILELTHEKHQLQNLSDSEQRTSERSIRLLRDQLDALEEQKAHQKRHFDELADRFDGECDSKRALEKSHTDLENAHSHLSRAYRALEKEKEELNEALQRAEAVVQENDLARKAGFRVEDYEARIQKAEAENSRLVETLNESEQKSQRLEKGLEELTQRRQLLESLQQVEKETLVAQQSELQQAHQEIASLKLQIAASDAEHARLTGTLAKERQNNAKQHEESDAERNAQSEEIERLQLEIEASKVSQAALQKEFETFKEMNCKELGNVEGRFTKASQELAEAKTTILTWMNKFNAVSDEKKKLEDNMLGLSEEQYSLQRQVEELRADQEARSLAEKQKKVAEIQEQVAQATRAVSEEFNSTIEHLKAKNDALQLELDQLHSYLAERSATTERDVEAMEELSRLKEWQRKAERERRVQEKEKKALTKLVQTLQARPELQQRALEGMLLSYQRGVEHSLHQLSESVVSALKNLGSVEERYRALKALVHRTKAIVRPGSGAGLNGDALASDEAHQLNDLDVHDKAMRYDFFCEVVLDLASKSQSERVRSLVGGSDTPDPIVVLQNLVAYDRTPEEELEASVGAFLKKSSVSLNNSTLLASQVIVEKENFLGTTASAFDFSGSQSLWPEAIEPLRQTQDAADHAPEKALVQSHHEGLTSHASTQVNLWKWKYFTQLLVEKARRCELATALQRFEGVSRAVAHMKRHYACIAWQQLKVRVQNQQLAKLHRMDVVRMLHLTKQLEQEKQAHCFAVGEDHIQHKKHEEKLCASTNDMAPHATFSPATTLALGNCIELLRQFCEAKPKDENQPATTIKAKTASNRGVADLSSHLIEINSNIGSWKLTLDRKITEFTERNNQLASLKTRCSELKDLVELNQRLIVEMERRAVGRQSIVDAAWDFSTAYKALSPAVRAQVFQAQDFLHASNRIIEDLQSLGLPRSKQTLSQTHSVKTHPLDETTHAAKLAKKVSFSASAAPSFSCPSRSRTSSAPEEPTKPLSDSNIALLESAVSSLKGANQRQQALQSALKDKSRSLRTATKKLEKQDLRFLLLRSFLQWKHTISLLRVKAD